MPLIDRNEAVLVVVDVQEKLLPHIDGAASLLPAISRLIEAFTLVEAPIVVTEQYRKGLGPTDPSIVATLGRLGRLGRSFAPIEKMTFGGGAAPSFVSALEALGRREVVLCGIEAHVCVLQTAVQLRDLGYTVFLAVDAVSSRRPRDVEIALRRMEQSGVRFTSVEMAGFELLRAAGTDAFRAWSRIIR